VVSRQDLVLANLRDAAHNLDPLALSTPPRPLEIALTTSTSPKFEYDHLIDEFSYGPHENPFKVHISTSQFQGT